MKETKHTVVMSASEAAEHFKAAQAATRKIQREPIGNGLFLSGVEHDGAANAEIRKDAYARKWESFNTLSGLRRTWVKWYIEGAILDFYYPIKHVRDLCPILITIVDAITSGELTPDFTEAQLLQWADGAGLMLTAAGLDAWRRITQEANTKAADTPAASDTGKAGAMVDAGTSPKVDGLNIAETIGATAWAEIEIQMSGTGIRARKAGTEKWNPARGWIQWDKLSMNPSQETRYFKIFTAIAAAGGAIPKEGGTDYNSAVHDLNTKMRAAFGLDGQAFKTEGAITKSMFADISVKR